MCQAFACTTDAGSAFESAWAHGADVPQLMADDGFPAGAGRWLITTLGTLLRTTNIIGGVDSPTPAKTTATTTYEQQILSVLRSGLADTSKNHCYYYLRTTNIIGIEEWGALSVCRLRPVREMRCEENGR